MFSLKIMINCVKTNHFNGWMKAEKKNGRYLEISIKCSTIIINKVIKHNTTLVANINHHIIC